MTVAKPFHTLKKYPNRYWMEWTNVRKHVLWLAKKYGGIVPSAREFHSNGLGGLIIAIGNHWGGIIEVRRKVGLGGLKICVECKKRKTKDVDFRLRGFRSKNKASMCFSNVCKPCERQIVDDYRATWRGMAAEMIRRARERAVRYGREFDIDKEWLYKRLQKHNFTCEATGLPLHRGAKCAGGYGFESRHSASLDRIDSSGGYTKNNTRVVCGRINIALGNLSDEQFEEFAMGFLKVRGFKVEK